MTAPRDRSGAAPAEAPVLHLVPDPVDGWPAAEDGEDPPASPNGVSDVHDEDDAEERAEDGAPGGGDDAHGVERHADGEHGENGHPSPIEQARETLAAADPAHVHRMVSALARPTHDSVLQALPYTPALEFHDPRCVVVEPEPMGIETPELYARAAYHDFDRVLVEAFSAPETAETLTALYHLTFSEGANVALVTNHGQIIDIALVMAALQSAMMAQGRSFGVLGERVTQEELAQRTNVLVSRMVTTRQAFSVPAVQVLQSAARTFLSIPQTASRRRVRMDAEIVRANNVMMRHELDLRLAEGGQILAMAASGSQDLTLPQLVHRARAMWRQRRGDDPGEAPTLHLQPLYDGTVALMQSCRYVLPVAICLDPATPACAIGGLTRVREADDCHRIMDWIALAHQEATGVPTIYHWREDDLLTQVRALIGR